MSSAPHTEISDDFELPQVFGRYLLVQRLSRGGMGEIFLAKHGLSGFEKLCVIKKVLPHLVEDQHFISRFVDEAQVAIQLHHNNIAQVFEVGRVGDEYFLSIEFVEGRDLRRVLSLLRKQDARLPVPHALFAVREVANGLSYAHRRTDLEGSSLNLVHCDISPPNVVLSFEGEVKIIDFGIAKSALRVTTTDPKIGFGKFGYMAPEQLVRGGVVDHRTDIYSTGVILYEVLTGKRLYKVGKDPDYRALARKVIRGEHDVPSDHGSELARFDAIVRRALATNPTQRYQSAAELRDDVQRVLVTLDPTMSSEKLGAYLRGLFTAELSEERRQAAALQATDLAPWQAQLSSQASDTVSFALADGNFAQSGAGGPYGGPPHGPGFAPMGPPGPYAGAPSGTYPGLASGPHAASGGYPGSPSGPHAAPSGRYPMPMAAGNSGATSGTYSLGMVSGTTPILAPRPARNKVALVGGVLVLALIGLGIAAVIVNRTPDSGDTDRVIAAVDAAVPAIRDAGADALAASPDAGVPPVEADAAVTIEPDPRDRRRLNRRKNNARRRPERGNPKTKPDQDQLSRDQVQAKFRSVSREYTKFKQLFGKQLESQWADLASYAQFAGSSPDALRSLDKRLDGFRAAMRKAQRDTQ